MAKATKAQIDQASAVLLRRLSQQTAAWLIGKPAVWLRDNAHLDGRNADGTYNAAKLVAAVQQEFKPAELSDADLEGVLQAVDDVAFEMTRPGVVANLLDRIESKHGAAGLAAVGAELLRALQEQAAIEAAYPEPAKPTADDIMAEAEGKVAELATWEARLKGRIVLACNVCGHYRWGRDWRKPPWPSGYAVDRRNGFNCPKCDADLEKQAKRRR